MSVRTSAETREFAGRPRRYANRLRCLSWLLVVTVGSGCQTNRQVENPVVGPRPPRVSDRMLAQLEGEPDAANGEPLAAADPLSPSITQVSDVRPAQAESNQMIRDEDLAARVNGRPVYVSEVLERYRPQLEAFRQQASPQAYHQARRELLSKELPNHIEQALVVDAVRKSFKADQWQTLQEKLDEFFYEHEVPDLQQRLKVDSLQAVEAEMQKAGTTLAAYRRVWGEKQLAAQWVSDKIPTPTVSAPELRAEYEQQIDKYREPEQIKWQECFISLVQSSGRDGAQQRLQQAIDELKQGATFDAIVEKYSDGPQASSGGHWDWTNPDSLADQKLNETLAKLELNQIGPVIENERGFRLVKLTGRRPARTVPFEDVQKELREAILQRKRADAAQKLIEDLRRDAHIETILDPPRT